MRYLLFNKPCGIISQFADEGMGHPGFKPYIDMADVYVAGCLDHDSEGLLRLSQPERGVRLRLHDIACESPSHLQPERATALRTTAALACQSLRLVRVTDWTASDEIALTVGWARLNTAC